MTGLEKMVQQIKDDAQAKVDVSIQEAQKKADEIMAVAAAQAEETVKAAALGAEAEAKALLDRAESAALLSRRTAILKVKQQIISEVISKAYQTLSEMETDAYFAFLIKMLDKYILPKEGMICFSEKDLQRLPEGVKADIEAVAAKHGGRLTVSGETKPIANGFVLVYGGIEENCTFEALFHTQRDSLADIINQKLFS